MTLHDDELVWRGTGMKDDGNPRGDVYQLDSGHFYEMGTRHDCGVEDCPANVGRGDE